MSESTRIRELTPDQTEKLVKLLDQITDLVVHDPNYNMDDLNKVLAVKNLFQVRMYRQWNCTADTYLTTIQWSTPEYLKLRIEPIKEG